MIWDMERDQSRRANVISSHFVHPFTRKFYWKAHSTDPILVSFTRPPTFIGRHAHLEDVALPTRQRRKRFGNRLTGPQLGARNPKPWRYSVTSSKARHSKAFVSPFLPQPEQMEKRFGEIENHARLHRFRNRMRVKPHLGRTPHGLGSIRSA